LRKRAIWTKTHLDLDADGNICSITIEYASTRADAPHFSYEEIAA